MPLIKPPISVGDEVWVCADAFVGPGVKIAHRAIVAARAVAVKDVKLGEIIEGNPATLIKHRKS